MNIEKANAISLPEILQKIGCQPTKTKGQEIWYNSPLRSEKTASFQVNTAKNIWYDFGIAKGGDTVAFVCAYLQSQSEDHTVPDALRWLRNMTFDVVTFFNLKDVTAEKEAALSLQSLRDITSRSLIKYLESRKIPLSVASKYLREACVLNKNTGKVLHALCIQNEVEGYELRNKFFKGCVGTKGITVIRGSEVPAKEVYLFEGMMDFLSAVGSQPDHHFAGDVIILNSVACLGKVYPYVRNYPYRTVITWFDNDTAGSTATKVIKELADGCGYGFEARNDLYKPYKDVNEWIMKLN